MKPLVWILVLMPAIIAAQSPAPSKAPSNPFVIEEHAVTRVSEHVYMIPCRTRPGVPNVGIIVGNKAALVFDTGMGQQSGEVDLREVQRLTKNPTIYLSTTDMRPEHTTGVQAFPPQTIWIVPEAQRQEIAQETMGYVQRFVAMSPDLKAVLKDVTLREPTITFDREARIDLGGVTARLLWFDPGVTRGDALVFVEGDRVLLAGNTLHSQALLGFPGAIASVTNWLAAIDKVEALQPLIILPNHGDTRDASLIPRERALLVALQARSRELKRQGQSAEEAGKILKPEFERTFPDWTELGPIPKIVLRLYAESQ